MRYSPDGKVEQSYFEKADKSITLTSVSEAPEQYSKKVVSWAGVIKSIDIKTPSDDSDYVLWKMVVQQHPYDWLIDRGIEGTKLFLERESEGLFEVNISIDRTHSNKMESKIKEASRAGNMVIAYGYPIVSKDGRIQLQNGFARPLSKKFIKFVDSDFYQ